MRASSSLAHRCADRCGERRDGRNCRSIPSGTAAQRSAGRRRQSASARRGREICRTTAKNFYEAVEGRPRPAALCEDSASPSANLDTPRRRESTSSQHHSSKASARGRACRDVGRTVKPRAAASAPPCNDLLRAGADCRGPGHARQRRSESRRHAESSANVCVVRAWRQGLRGVDG